MVLGMPDHLPSIQVLDPSSHSFLLFGLIGPPVNATCTLRVSPQPLFTMQLCVQKLRIFIEDSDQNLKYLGLQVLPVAAPPHLQSMANVLKIQPKAVAAHRFVALCCSITLDGCPSFLIPTASMPAYMPLGQSSKFS